MATQYSCEENFLEAKIEYQAEELKKKFLYTMANFAHVKYKRAMLMRMSGLDLK